MNNKVRETAYHVGTGVFGTAHLVFTAAAELCVSAEIAITKKTGIWDNGKVTEVTTDRQVEQIWEDRVTESITKINKAKLRMEKYRSAFSRNLQVK